MGSSLILGLLAGLLAVGADAHAPFVVALDAGHGGSAAGTAGVVPGVVEKTVTLDLAHRIERKLAGQTGVQAIVCRTRDAFMTIRARVRCAQQAQARLFISLHANSSPEGPTRGSQRGFELYVSPLRDVDLDAAWVARKAGGAADAAWAGHQVRAAAEDSLTAARRISWRLADVLGRDRDRGIKQEGASLDVLQGLGLPGVLVEVGFLDHPEEGRELASPQGRERIATALAEAVIDLASRERRGRADPSITAPVGSPFAEPALPRGNKNKRTGLGKR